MSNRNLSKKYSAAALLLLALGIALNLFVPMLRYLDVLHEGGIDSVIANLREDSRVAEWYSMVFWPTILASMLVVCLLLFRFFGHHRNLLRLWCGATSLASLSVITYFAMTMNIYNSVGIITAVLILYSWYVQEKKLKAFEQASDV